MRAETVDNSLDKLKSFLNNLFQFESQELDFGIYKILHYKRKEIKDFIEKLLVETVQSHLQTISEVQLQETAEETKNSIYNHLLLFFSRYYDKGDFITKRRFGKTEKYIVPYNGEEVHFYWANHDQYYIKSSEGFQKYSFKVQNPECTVIVNFKLTQAQTDQGNVKKDDVRYFILSAKPPQLKDNTLDIFFEYRVLNKEENKFYTSRNKQDTLNEVSANSLQEILKKHTVTANLWANEGEATVLLNKLNQYTRKNNYDFFIHRNLKPFLERELDFYIKSELINVEDIYVADTATHFEHIRQRLKMVKVFNQIANTIIDFLAQIEDFQKKLWEKKKFVIETEWVITIDKLYKYLDHHHADLILIDVLKNQSQTEEWAKEFGDKIFNIDLTSELSIADINLKDFGHLKLPIDTKHFDKEFKDRLLNFLSDTIDIETEYDGFLINTDNYHGLQLTKEKLRKKVDGIYIDPPYNTNATIIIYKNGFKDSSWNTMISNRIEPVNDILKDEGVMCATIDDYEYNNLYNILKKRLIGKELRTTVIEYNYRGRVKSNFAITHEYGLWAIKSEADLITRYRSTSDEIKRNLRRTGSSSRRFESPTMFYGIEVNRDTLEIVAVHDALEVDAIIPEHISNTTVMVYPIDDNGIERRWYYGIDRVRDEMNKTVYARRIAGKIKIHYTKEGTPTRRKTVWTDKLYDASTYGSELINDLFGIKELKHFDFPKSVYAVQHSLEAMSYKNDAWFMDFFGGSGTTYHATQLMNVGDKGKRKCILFEQGSYFHTVIIPRIKKIAFSTVWVKGKPVKNTMDGVGAFFKYQRIEQYEEALENIALNVDHSTLQEAIQFDQYMPKYFLGFESKDSRTFVNTDLMENPWEYKLKVWDGYTYDNETEVDLIETFNYLLGIHMKKSFTRSFNGLSYKLILGTTNSNKEILVVWRNTKGWSAKEYEADALVLNKLLPSFTFDTLYINGQAQVQGYQPIEEIFKNKMLSL